MTSSKREVTGFSGGTCRPRAEDTLDSAGARCKARGLRMTSGWRKVLRILLWEHRPLGAYETLDPLCAEETKAQPAIVYRALHFLDGHRFAHRSDRPRAYVACTDPDELHSPAFMICRLCHVVAEANLRPAAGSLGMAAKAVGFRMERTEVEAEGVCPTCADTTST